MKTLFVAILTLSLMLTYTFSQEKPSHPKRPYEEAIRLLDTKKYHDLLTLLPQLSKRDREILLIICIARQDVSMGALLIDDFHVDPNCEGEEEFCHTSTLDMAAKCSGRAMIEMLVLRGARIFDETGYSRPAEYAGTRANYSALQGLIDMAGPSRYQKVIEQAIRGTKDKTVTAKIQAMKPSAISAKFVH